MGIWGCGYMDYDNKIIDYESYFNQTAYLKRHTGETEFSSDSYSEIEEPIKVRVSRKSEFFRNKDDVMTVANQVYKTLTKVNSGDLVDGLVVKSVKTVTEFDGTVAYYKIYL